MGQKVNPISNRLGIIRGWDSNWYGGKNYGDRLLEDSKIRKYLNARLAKASVSRIVIERTLDAEIVASNVARQIEGKIAYRRAVKMAIASTMRMGAEGIKVQVSGRLNGAEMARSEMYKEGRTPLHTLRADIDYALVEAHTKVGVIGVKVWICRGEVYGKKDLAPAFTNSAKEARGGNGAPKKGFRKPKTNR
jgi:small subunit ribosomal protein S3